MKKLILLLSVVLLCGISVAQTNYFWSANFTSNYIRNFFRTNAVQTNISAYVDAALLTNNLARSNSAPFSTLFSGQTTNVAVLIGTNGSGVNITNWFCFTNGVLCRISVTNVP